MRFEYPVFLFALLVLLIPIIVHLFNFRRYKKLYFSNVQFLKQVNEQQAAGRNLKERLILLSRLLALFFLVMAFAKPFIAKNGTGATSGKLVVSIFIDNSNSMQALGSEGSLIDEAKSRAKQIAASYDLNTRFQLLTQDFFGKDQRLIDRSEFNNEVDGVTLSSQSRNLGDIINRQQSLLQNTGVGTSYLISDFQLGMAGKAVNIKGLQINLVQLKANDLPNVSIDSVWLQGAVHRPDDTEKLVFKLHNYANEKAMNIPLKLFINGKQKGLSSYTVNAGAVITDTIIFSGLQAGWQRAELRLQDNPVTFDDIFYLSFYVAAQMPVLLIDNGSPNIYIKSAFESEPFFKLTSTPFGSVNYSSLQSYPFVVMSGVHDVSAGLSQQLRTYVQKGGNLMVFPAADLDLNSYKTFLQGLNAPTFNIRKNDTTQVSRINLNAVVYKNTFEREPQNPDLPKVTSFFPLGGGSGSTEQMLSFQDGTPFWEVSKYKSGKVYVCAVPVDKNFSNLPRHSLFVTTLLRIGLLSGNSQALYSTLGQAAPVRINNINTGADEVLKLTDGKQQIIPDARNLDGTTTLYLSDQVSKPGSYKLVKKDRLIGLLSFNGNRRESDMHYYSPSALKDIFGKNSKIVEADRAVIKNKANNLAFGFQLWKLCLLLTLIFLGAEIFLIRFFKVPKGTYI